MKAGLSCPNPSKLMNTISNVHQEHNQFGDITVAPWLGRLIVHLHSHLPVLRLNDCSCCAVPTKACPYIYILRSGEPANDPNVYLDAELVPIHLVPPTV